MNQALLIIDAQQALMDGTHGERGVFNKENVIQNINLAIEKAIESDTSIICIRDTSVAGGEGPGFQVHKDIKVPSTAPIFDKSSINSYYETPLLDYLREKEIEHIVIVGCATDYCIDTAVRTSTLHQFDVTLVGDGHSTEKKEYLSADLIIRHHNAVLHGHNNGNRFCVVRQAEEDLFSPIHENYRED